MWPSWGMRRCGLTLSSVLEVSLLCFVVIFVPTSVGGSVPTTAPVTSLSAPFNHTVAGYTNLSEASGGCSTLTFPIAPHFYAKTGNAGISLRGWSPPCPSRGSGLGTSRTILSNEFNSGIRIKAPTGWDNITLNMTITWKVSWSVTKPTCSMSSGAHRFSCSVSADAGVSGFLGSLTHWSTNATARIPHAGGIYNSFGSWTPSGVSSWGYGCTNYSKLTCGTTASSVLNGTLTGNSTGVFGFDRYFLNSSNYYLVSFMLYSEVDTESDHTPGGSMVGGTAHALVAVQIHVNSVVIA
jgi:hypothetical protein